MQQDEPPPRNPSAEHERDRDLVETKHRRNEPDDHHREDKDLFGPHDGGKTEREHRGASPDERMRKVSQFLVDRCHGGSLRWVQSQKDCLQWTVSAVRSLSLSTGAFPYGRIAYT